MFLKIYQISQENTGVGDSNTHVFLWNYENFKNTYFEEDLWTTVSVEIVCRNLRTNKFIYVGFDYLTFCFR